MAVTELQAVVQPYGNDQHPQPNHTWQIKEAVKKPEHRESCDSRKLKQMEEALTLAMQSDCSSSSESGSNSESSENERNSQSGEAGRYYYVEWHVRRGSGIVPMDSYVSEAEIKEADWIMLFNFLHVKFMESNAHLSANFPRKRIENVEVVE